MCCSTALAQSGAGSIQGTVTDPTGAVIIGASIRVVNHATGVAIDTKSNSVGFYQVPELFTGTYVVSVTAAGMKTYNQTLELLVGQNAVFNVSLSAGAVTQQVTVSANVVQLVITDNGTLSSTLENERINELPMNGRSIITLVGETTPGLENCPSGIDCANGQESSATEFVADGVTLTNRQFGGVDMGAAQMVDPDAIQEVHVETSTSGAQFAAPATPVITTKSGTNQLHGSLFETARNNAVGIARNRSNPSNYVAPELVRNEFGASVGGPILIPHLYNGKDKSFFFFAYERYSLAQKVDDNLSAPTQAMRNGDFSGLTTSSGVLQELYDPNTTKTSASCLEPSSVGTAAPADTWCRQPFGGNPSTGSTNNYIPPSRESPTTVLLNEMTPLPTNANNPLVQTNLVQPLGELTIEPQITFRLDHEFNENNRAYLRYTQNVYSSSQPHTTTYGYSLAAGNIPANASNLSFNPEDTFATALGFTHIFSPTFFSETILSQQWMGQYNYAGGKPNTDYESELGTPNNFGSVGFPFVENIFQAFEGTQFVYGMSQKISQADENLSKTVGKHQLLFGGRYRFEQFGVLPDQSSDTILFSGEGTGLENPSSSSASPAAYANTGQLNADEFLGSASTYTANLEPKFVHMRDMEFDAYLQDNYRVSRTLTLNLGLRYEAHPAMWVGNGNMIGFDLKNDAIVTSAPTSQLIAEGLTSQAVITNDELNDAKFETPAQAGMPSMLVNNYDLTFGPRFGFAWQPFGKWGTVLRGGLGRYIYPVPVRVNNDLRKQNPFLATYTENYDTAQYAPDSLNDYQLRSVLNSSPSYSYTTTQAGGGVPIMGVNSANAVNSTSVNAIAPGLAPLSMSQDTAPAYTEEVNFTIEQPLKWNSALRLGWVYTRGGNLYVPWYFNAHPNELVWEVQTGTTPPNGSAVGPTNATTGEGPYDNVAYSSGIRMGLATGWSNYNALQATYQKLYHSGIAWQVMYVWSKSLRTGLLATGGSYDAVDPYSSYSMSGPATVTYAPEGGTFLPPNLPPSPPTGVPAWGYYKALNRWENYMIDTNNPPQHFQFNALVDLPFGRGKRLLGNVNRPLNEVVGGWQLAGDGSIVMTQFPITTTNWGPTSPLQIYKKHPITDCRSGVCLQGIQWFNGYIAPTAVSGNTCSAGLTAVVSGLPTSWVPYQTPIDTICSAPSGGKTVVDKYYGLNDAIVNGVTGQNANAVISYPDVPSGSDDNGSSGSAIDITNPFSKTFLNGPADFKADASVFKVFPIKEEINLRFTVDAFNVFNIQGLNNPSGSDGTEIIQAGGVGASSRNAARQLQFTARLTF